MQVLLLIKKSVIGRNEPVKESLRYGRYEMLLVCYSLLASRCWWVATPLFYSVLFVGYILIAPPRLMTQAPML